MTTRALSFAIPLLLASLALPATQAGAQAPSIRPGMPPEVLSLRTTILSKDDYSRLADQWRAYTKEHPTEAIGFVQLYRAMRYGNQGSQEEREGILRKALEVGPDCPEALEQMAGWTHAYTQDRAEGMGLARRAVELAPAWAEPHFILTSFAAAEGKTAEVRANLRAILEKGGMASPVLDFGHNLLVSAEPNAIVFTNGDNDTYAPMALQAVRGFRPDVAVVNLSLLNIDAYAVNVWKAATWTPPPFTEASIREHLTAWQEGKVGKGRPFSHVLLQDLVERVRSGQWTGPVYMAVTVAPNFLDLAKGHSRIEGLLWRVMPDSWEPPQGSDREKPIEGPRTLDLFRNAFRLDSATDLAYPWGPKSSVGMLMTNYPALLQAAAADAAGRGDLAEAGYALGMALEILDFHGEKDKAKAMAKYWKEIDPGAKVPDRWK